MGIYIYNHAIKTEELEKVYGCCDENLITKALEINWFDSFDDSPNFNIESALQDIIFRKPYHKDVAHWYGYAMILLCHVLGKGLPFSQDIKIGIETDWINRVLNEEFKFKNIQIELELIPDNNNFTFIPPPIDFPLIAIHRQNHLRRLAKLFDNIVISQEMIDSLQDSGKQDDEERSYAYTNIKGTIENIHFCLTNQLDMVSFCH